MTTRAMLLVALVATILAAMAGGSTVAGPLKDADAAEKRSDHATAISIYRSLADKGDTYAQRRLASYYELGLGFKRNWLEAAKWYSKAADAGSPEAAWSLGQIGRNWPFMNPGTSDETIYELVKRAAQKGHAVAQMSLGVMNYSFDANNFARRKNPKEASIWYRKAAAQGNVDSQILLGIAYEDGIGVPQDYVEAHKWYNLAASRSEFADSTFSIERGNALALRMTPSQIAEAQKLAGEWKPKAER